MASSSEYLFNPGLRIANVRTAWNAGATGAGQTVAVIDDGVPTTHFDLIGRVRSESIDLYASTRMASDVSAGHGARVADLLAAGFNNLASVGVAFNAKILSIRADEPGSCSTSDGCGFSTLYTGQGIDYATGLGVKIINMSLGGDNPSSASFQAALGRLVTAGGVLVVSAGNESGAEPTYPARWGADSRFTANVLAVGALNADGSDIAAFSNRAGSAMDRYLLAPGTSVSYCDAGGNCFTGSGTSFAAPHVSGAMALLLEGFPTLTPVQAADILLRTATDMGATGVDPIYGHGKLNIDRAFQPIGALSLSSGSGGAGASLGETAQPALLGQAFGQVALPNMATVGFDEYHRMYGVDLAGVFHSQGTRSPLVASPGPVESSSTEVAVKDGAKLAFSAERGIGQVYTPGGAAGLAEADRQTSIALSLVNGATRFDLWSGRAGFAPSSPDPFAQLAFARQTARAAYTMGRWTLSAEQGFGARGEERGLDFMANPAALSSQPTAYTRAGAAYRAGRWTGQIAAGLLVEQGGPLGSSLPANTAFSMPSQTRYAQAEASVTPIEGLTFTARGAIGETRARGGALDLAAMSSSWSIEAAALCDFWCSGVSLSLRQPVRVEQGRLSAWLADQPAAYLDPLTYSRRSTGLSPGAREIDLGLGLWRNLGNAGVARLQANLFTNEGNRRDAAENVGVTASWARQF